MLRLVFLEIDPRQELGCQWLMEVMTLETMDGYREVRWGEKESTKGYVTRHISTVETQSSVPLGKSVRQCSPQSSE